MGTAIPDYLNILIKEKIVHPDDAESYRNYSNMLFSGESMAYQSQEAVAEGVYERFDVKSKFIYNENREPTEIFGTMKTFKSRI